MIWKRRIRSYEHAMKLAEGKELEECMERYTGSHSPLRTAGWIQLPQRTTGPGSLQQRRNSESPSPHSPAAKTILLTRSRNLIILDEPTNHLDMSSISWLETS